MVACGNIRDKYLQLVCMTLNVPVRRNGQERVSLAVDPSEHCKDFTERRGDPSWTPWPALRHVKGRDFWNKRFSTFNASHRVYFFSCLLLFSPLYFEFAFSESSLTWAVKPANNWQSARAGRQLSLLLADLNFLSLSFVRRALWTNGLGLACGLNFQVESLPSPILH